ncbi:MAG: thioredoxin family protein [Streptococcaceae bacterium]|jgi:thiol-disulfide isomerase/thioredoxin|nr:thioredoxin family protein [Streptococcaceae bacterium]
MKEPKSYEEIAEYIKAPGKHMFYFSATWCGDCKFIEPKLPEIEAENSEFEFIHVDRDEYMDLAVEWGIMGIPSFVAIEDGKEIGRLVNKLRKTKEEVNAFISTVK